MLKNASLYLGFWRFCWKIHKFTWVFDDFAYIHVISPLNFQYFDKNDTKLQTCHPGVLATSMKNSCPWTQESYPSATRIWNLVFETTWTISGRTKTLRKTSRTSLTTRIWSESVEKNQSNQSLWRIPALGHRNPVHRRQEFGILSLRQESRPVNTRIESMWINH